MLNTLLLLLRRLSREKLREGLLPFLQHLEIDLRNPVVDLVAAHGLAHRDALLRSAEPHPSQDGDALPLPEDAAPHGKSAVVRPPRKLEFIAGHAERVPLEGLADVHADQRLRFLLLFSLFSRRTTTIFLR